MISPRWHRAGHDGNSRFRRMLGFSALIHILFLGFFIFSMNIPTPKWTFGPVYSVHLVSLSDQATGGKTASSINKEILQPRPAPPAIILRKPVETTSAVPLRKTEVQKTPTTGIEKAMEAIKNKVQSAPKQPPSAVKQALQTEGQTGQGDAGGRMDPYYSEIWSRIRGQWSMPQEILPKGNVETIINVKILRNGSVVDAGFEKRSGSRYFDESAVRAIKKASPLPPLPSWIRGDSIEIGIRFRSAELR